MKLALATGVGAIALALSGPLLAGETPMNLAGSEWGFGDDDPRYIQFKADGQVAGTGGCNNFFGGYKQKGMTIDIGPLASTRKACSPEIMESEDAFFVALDSAEGFRASHLVLKLFAADGSQILELKRRDWD